MRRFASHPSGALERVQTGWRRFVEPVIVLFEGSNPGFTRYKKGRCGPFSVPGGEGGIRTLEGLLGPYSLSRGAPSTTRPPLRFKLRSHPCG